MLLGFIYNLTAGSGSRDDATDEDDDNDRSGDAPVSLEELADEELMARYRDAGDVPAFEELVSRHEDSLLNFILRSVGRMDVAEDLLQEVFIRVVKSAPDWKPKAKFTTWVFTIARNLCIDRARRKKGKHTYSLDRSIGGGSGGSSGDSDGSTFVDHMADEEADSASVDHDRRSFRRKLAAALDELPDDQREVFVLREFSGLKYKEIAEVVDSKVPTVKSRMRYALKSLRGHLADWKEHSFDREERDQMEADT